MDGRMDVLKEGKTGRRMEGRTGSHVARQKNRKTDGRMDRRTDRQSNVRIPNQRKNSAYPRLFRNYWILRLDRRRNFPAETFFRLFRLKRFLVSPLPNQRRSREERNKNRQNLFFRGQWII